MWITLQPGITLGFIACRRTAGVLDRGDTGPTVLFVSAAAGAAAIQAQLV